MGCNNEYTTRDYLGQCPECGEFNPEIIQGRELSVKSIVIDK
jgi:Zn finger protein HypA/HybF involved in hydrogenase expression